MKNPDAKKGELGDWEVTVDWDNADWHLRQALEGQMILDMATPDLNILSGEKKDWRMDILFPKYSEGKSLSKGGRGKYLSDYYSLKDEQYEMQSDLRKQLEEDFMGNLGSWLQYSS